MLHALLPAPKVVPSLWLAGCGAVSLWCTAVGSSSLANWLSAAGQEVSLSLSWGTKHASAASKPSRSFSC